MQSSRNQATTGSCLTATFSLVSNDETRNIYGGARHESIGTKNGGSSVSIPYFLFFIESVTVQDRRAAAMGLWCATLDPGNRVKKLQSAGEVTRCDCDIRVPH